jgi:hypothetical protein
MNLWELSLPSSSASKAMQALQHFILFVSLFLISASALSIGQGAYLVFLHAVPSASGTPVSLTVDCVTDTSNDSVVRLPYFYKRFNSGFVKAATFLFGNQTSFIVPWDIDFKIEIRDANGNFVVEANYHSATTQPCMVFLLYDLFVQLVFLFRLLPRLERCC